MWKCRKYRGAMAAMLYDECDAQERRALEEHMQECPVCKREYDSLASLAHAIPRETPALDADLVPAIRRRLAAARPEKTPAFRWRYAMAMTAVCVLIAVGAVYQFLPANTSDTTVITAAIPAAPPPAPTALAAVLGNVETLTKQHNYSAAYIALKEGLAKAPQDPEAAKAQSMLADIAFSQLKWYPEAHEAYDRLAKDYASEFTSSREAISRRDLLAEARARDYAPLHALDAARRSTDGQFEKLEKVLAQYPGPIVASEVASDMARLAAAEVQDQSGSTHLAAMEHARDRCTSPVAVAQLNLEVGHIYLRELSNPDKARACYAEGAESDNPVVAETAKGLLARLDAAGANR